LCVHAGVRIQVFERSSGPKEPAWIEGEQIEFYDQPQQVDQSVAAIHAWFGKHLSAPGALSALSGPAIPDERDRSLRRYDANAGFRPQWRRPEMATERNRRPLGIGTCR
jgi:hypothetical protein